MQNGPTDDQPRRFYVSAIDGSRRYIIAGPYETHEHALNRVEPVRIRASEMNPRACFMAWGTCGQPIDAEAIKTPLGDF